MSRKSDELQGIDQRLLTVTRRYWGFDRLLPFQEEAMECVLKERDSLLVLPTGGGKSLCYQAPAMCLEGLTIVVSPLISLMKDQVDSLRSSGIAAAYTNSSLSIAERQQVADEVRAGTTRLLYLAPERLVSEATLSFLSKVNVARFAIDEAHCISAWGHDFRPEFRSLEVLRERFPHVSIHAFTATATQQVRDDIVESLRLRNAKMLVGDFDRPNLNYKNMPRCNRMMQITEVLDRHPGDSGIIYCITRNDVERIALQLCDRGYRALPYHAGMEPDQRQRNQDAFIEERVDTLVATVAFGMGIDKSNVRYVIHAGMPKSLENYQQESGRAGRDRLEAECVLFYSGGDFALWKQMLEDRPDEGRDEALESLRQMFEYSTGVRCRHRAIVEHFGQSFGKGKCGACDVCAGDLDVVEGAEGIARKIVSCVARLGERFGGQYTALVLRGSREKRILDQNHDALSTWGLLAEYDQQSIRDWIEQLVGQEFLAKVGEYNVLEVTHAGHQLLAGAAHPQLLRRKDSRRSRSTEKTAIEAASWEGVDRDLFAVLRELRRVLAIEQGVPAYIVFGDETLRDMARIRPTNLPSFHTVRGVGEKKMRDYGEQFVEAITEYCDEQKVSTDLSASAKS